MDFLMGILASIIAAIFCALFLWLYNGSKGYLGIRKTIRLINDCNKSGIVNVFSSRASYIEHKDHGTAAKYISRSKYSLLYVGFWLATGIEVGSIIEEIKKLVYNSKIVCIVFIDTASDKLLEQCSIYLGISPNELKIRVETSLEKLIQLKANLSNEYKKNLIIKKHNILLSASAFLIDIEQVKECSILVDYKLYGFSRDDGYGIEYKGTKIMTSKIKQSYLRIREEAMEVTTE
jgi:hypothetical protein